MTSMENMTEASFQSNYLEVDKTRIHYIEQGQGNPIILLHSVPASSWVWRNIIPILAPLGRCIAPDLAGFGKSGDPDHAYTLQDHIHHLEHLINTLKLDRITFVLHGWGSIPGFDYAMRHEKKCRGIAFYESWICPAKDEYISLPWQEQMLFWLTEKNLRDVMQNGMHFVDQVLRQTAMQPFDENLMAHYCAAFLHPGAGKSVYQYLSEAPCGDGKRAADKIIAAYSEKLQKSKLPKLMLYSLPGFITTIATLVWAKDHLQNLEVADVGEDLHFAQESRPEMMGELISAWLQAIEQKGESRK